MDRFESARYLHATRGSGHLPQALGSADCAFVYQAMKIGELTSFAHNVADSLASGTCLMAGYFSVDVFGEAAASPRAHIVVDFLTGSTSGSPTSPQLRNAVKRYSDLLPELAMKHGIQASEIKVFSARFGTDVVEGYHFAVTVETSDGRRSIDQYAGIPGRRFSRPRRTVGAT